MNKIKKISAVLLSLTLVLSTSALGVTSKVDYSKGAIKAFQKLIKEYPKNVGFHKALSHWGFKLPSGEKFEWTKDMSANKVDLAIVLMADQFTSSGLDIKKLPSDWLYKPAAVEGGVSLPNRLIWAYNVSDGRKFSMGSVDALKVILKKNPSILDYYKAEGHYMLSLGEGYQVHFAQKLHSSSPDVEFVVKADELVKAGLDVKKLQKYGWKEEMAGKGDSGKNANQLVKEFKLQAK